MLVRRVVAFPPFRLDWESGSLWRETKQLPQLRAKNLAVLRSLVEHAGQLVPTEEFVRSIWQNYPSAREALKQSIFQLRHVLGDSATNPRFIETVGQRGYRFIATVQWEQPQEENTLASVIGREKELRKLQELFEHVRQGKRQLVFISGEPGVGKTTLVDAFLRGISSNPTVWVGQGQCIEQYGQGEAYLPVLDALGHLRDRSGIELFVQFFARYAPTWLLQMPALLDHVDMDTLQRKTHGTNRERMLREFIEAVEAFTIQAESQPAPLLVLIVEDLHWGDYSTVDLLSALARRRTPARLMIIGTYRSAGGLSNNHPLRPLLQELRSHGQCSELPLNGWQEADIEQYLTKRFPHSVLPARLASFLYQRTRGNPLFLVHLINDLIEQHLLVKDDEGWAFQGTLEVIATYVPETSRQLILRQMARVTPQEAHVLSAASVAGTEFSAAAVAAALQTDLEAIEESCQQLVEGEEFLRPAGISEWPDTTKTSRYAFRHALFQELWYEQVPLQRRQRFHRHIGERLEQAYTHHTKDVAAELALHFEQGRDFQRALPYLQQAAQNAIQRFAHQEAASHLTRGLQLLTTLPDTPTRARQELGLQITLGPTLMVAKGYAAPEVEHAFSRARELCQQMGDALPLFPVLLGTCGFYLVRAELQKARELGAHCLNLAQQGRDPDQLLGSHSVLGLTLFYQGAFSVAHEHQQQVLALYDPQRHRMVALRSGEDARITGLYQRAIALWLLGYPQQALLKGQEAFALAQDLGHPFIRTGALVWTGCWLPFLRRDVHVVQSQAKTVVALSRDLGFPVWAAVGRIFQGWALVEQEQKEEGTHHLEQGLAALRATGAGLNYPNYMALLAEAYAKGGQPDRGLALLAESFAIIDKTGERHFAAELHRLKGELLLQQRATQETGSGVYQEAEEYFQKALAIARTQHARSLELRAVMSLYRLHSAQGREEASRSALTVLYDSFTEGWETPDLQEAKALLGVPTKGKR